LFVAGLTGFAQRQQRRLLHKIDQHYGSSDHVTCMQYGIPVMFIT